MYHVPRLDLFIKYLLFYKREPVSVGEWTWAACRCGRLENVSCDSLSRHAVCYWCQLYSVVREGTSNTRVIYWRDPILGNERMWKLQHSISLKSQKYVCGS